MQNLPAEISVVAAAAVCGCLGTAIAFRAVTGKPASTIALNWRKHVWSIIFVMPVLFLIYVPLPKSVTLLVAIVWLIMGPSVAAKYFFGSKDTPWSFLLMLHSAFAFTTTAAIVTLHHLLGLPLSMAMEN